MSVVENVVEGFKYQRLAISGSFVAEVAKQPKPKPVTSFGRQGVGITLKILEGEFAGHQVPVDLLVKGQRNDRRVNYDVDVLTAWCDLLGRQRRRATLTGLIELLRQAGQGKRIEFKLERQTTERRPRTADNRGEGAGAAEMIFGVTKVQARWRGATKLRELKLDGTIKKSNPSMKEKTVASSSIRM